MHQKEIKKVRPGRGGPCFGQKKELFGLGSFNSEICRGELRSAGVLKEPGGNRLILFYVFLRVFAGNAELHTAHGFGELIKPGILERFGKS